MKSDPCLRGMIVEHPSPAVVPRKKGGDCVPLSQQRPGQLVLSGVTLRRSPLQGLLPDGLTRTGRCHFSAWNRLHRKTGIIHWGNCWFGFDFHSKQ